MGSTRISNPYNEDVYLIKTDQNGDTMWTRTYGGSGWDDGWSVRQTDDGGYIITGFNGDLGFYKDVYLIRTDTNGDTLWTKKFGGNYNDQGLCLQITLDGGFIICGNTESYGAGLYDAFLLKIDSSGNADWFRTYGGSGVDYGHFVEQTTDGGYIITGASSPSIGGYDVYLIRTDSLGYVLWERTFGGSRNDFGYCVRQTSDGGFIIAGSTSSFGHGGGDFYVIRTDVNGDTIWTNTYGGSDLDVGYSVLQTSDSGFLVAGETASFGNYDAYLIKTNSNGDTIWTKTFGGNMIEFFKSINPTSDNGPILCGATSSFGSGYGDIWLVKLEGEMNLSLTPSMPTIIIPASGGSFDFISSIYNGAADTITFDVWTSVTLPNGRSLEPVLLRNGLNIAPAATIVREINQYVPGNAPPGNYMYIGNIGFYPDSVMDSDRFGFIKLP